MKRSGNACRGWTARDTHPSAARSRLLAGHPLRAIRPELPANLETVIGRALAQDPADRFQSVAELSAGFASVTAKTGVFERLFGEA